MVNSIYLHETVAISHPSSAFVLGFLPVDAQMAIWLREVPSYPSYVKRSAILQDVRLAPKGERRIEINERERRL
jgi:hypothetical protein